jgi:hypothetical protein
MERQKKATIARRLYENGVQIEVDDAWRDRALCVRQIGESSNSYVFDLGNGATGFTIDVNIEIMKNNLIINGMGLEAPWADPSITLLADPAENAPHYQHYKFCQSYPIKFGRQQVLNHQLGDPKACRPRKPLQGLLLWSGMQEIPDAFRHAGDLPVTVFIYDQFYVEYSFNFNLWIDRTHKWSPANRRKNLRQPLFSKKMGYQKHFASFENATRTL